jgi:hypothetical protein
MIKKPLAVLCMCWCMCVIGSPLSTVLFAQDTAPQHNKAVKESRWEGEVVRSSLEQQTLTVRQLHTNHEMVVNYGSSTRWVSQEHGSKKVNDIDAHQVNDGDRVIVKGHWDKHKFQATLISKRLSHSKSK